MPVFNLPSLPRNLFPSFQFLYIFQFLNSLPRSLPLSLFPLSLPHFLLYLV